LTKTDESRRPWSGTIL